MQKQYSIRNIEQITGIKAATIRMWEKRYNLIEPKRTSTNIRYYDAKDIKKLLLIADLLKSGYKISELANLSFSELYERAIILFNDEKILYGDLNYMMRIIIDFNHVELKQLINQLIIKYGFEYTFNFAILPFLYKLDAAYNDGDISEAEKNFAFFIIENMLITALNRSQFNSSDRKFVLFTNQNKINRIILLFGAYVLTKKNKDIIMLGEFENIENFFEIIETFNNHNIMTTTFNFKNENALLIEFAEKYPDFNFFILDPNIVLETDLYINIFPIQNLLEIEKEII